MQFPAKALSCKSNSWQCIPGILGMDGDRAELKVANNPFNALFFAKIKKIAANWSASKAKATQIF